MTYSNLCRLVLRSLKKVKLFLEFFLILPKHFLFHVVYLPQKVNWFLKQPLFYHLKLKVRHPYFVSLPQKQIPWVLMFLRSRLMLVFCAIQTLFLRTKCCLSEYIILLHSQFWNTLCFKLKLAIELQTLECESWKCQSRCRMSSLENLSEFVLEPGPEDCLVRCRVTRNNKGIDKGRVSSEAKLMF